MSPRTRAHDTARRMVKAKRAESHGRPEGEPETDLVVEILNVAELTTEQAERIASVLAMRARIPRPIVTTGTHVLQIVDGATLSRDEAKLVGIRAIRRAIHLEEASRRR